MATEGERGEGAEPQVHKPAVSGNRDPRLDLLKQLIGSMPGLSAETNLEALRDEWER